MMNDTQLLGLKHSQMGFGGKTECDICLISSQGSFN